MQPLVDAGSGHLEFGRNVEAYFRRRWDRFPSAGSAAGLHEYDERIEIPDRELLEDHHRDVRATLRWLEGVESGELRAESRRSPAKEKAGIEARLSAIDTRLFALDRRAFRAHLALSELKHERLAHWRTNPIRPPQRVLDAIFELLMRRDARRTETAAAVCRRLESIPRYLKAARGLLSDPVRLWVEAALRTTQGGLAFLEEAIPPLAARHPSLAGDLNRAQGVAAEALGEYHNWLRWLEGQTLSDDPAAGRETLQTIVRESHALPYSLEEIEQIGHAEVQRLQIELLEAARTIDAEAAWHEILHREQQGFAATGRDLLAEYRRATAWLRERIVAGKVLDLPAGETCEVVRTPAFLRSVIPTAAYSAPGPLDGEQRGIFYVTEPPADLPGEQLCANLGQHFGLESTCAHEAYPGHHVQLCSANRATSLARKLADHIIFMEGWTLYSEQLMIELGWLDSPVWRLMYLVDQLWRAYRILIDVGVHTRRMSVGDAVELLHDEVGFTILRAQNELNWYTQSPGTPMSYLLGKHQTLALRERYFAGHGRDLRGFHNWLLSFGSVPQGWLGEHV